MIIEVTIGSPAGKSPGEAGSIFPAATVVVAREGLVEETPVGGRGRAVRVGRFSVNILIIREIKVVAGS